MNDHTAAVSGKITHIFFHRFVVETQKGPVLADVTPHGLDKIALHIGDHVSLEGEMKPSELKVSRFTHDGRSVVIEHKKKDDHKHHAHADPNIAIRAAQASGYEPVGEPRRKPKHFEVLARREGRWNELHIELDGHIRKQRPVTADDEKWNALLEAN